MRLRVELNREQIQVFTDKSLQGSVIDIGKERFTAFRKGVFVYRKPMILGGDENFAIAMANRLV
jgi:hypothetical protein